MEPVVSHFHTECTFWWARQSRQSVACLLSMSLVRELSACRRSRSVSSLLHTAAARYHELPSAGPSPSPAAAAALPRWHELPPVPPRPCASRLGCTTSGKEELTALRWVAQCCPGVPHSLLHRLFRKRQVRVRTELAPKPHRVSEKEALAEGAVVCVPASLAEGAAGAGKKVAQPQTDQVQVGEAEARWLHGLVLHRDPEVLVINKPAGMSVQGGTGVERSLDSVMAEALSFGYSEGPRLVHRLDKDTSGVLILGRTAQSTALLHALFREKTAVAEVGDVPTIERRYLALVMGSPRQQSGRISAPLVRVVLDKGWSDRIVVADRPDGEGVVSAVTEYTVLGSSIAGCTWLELRPLTGRKHQLRVHCAEVLGVPIIGDYRYGWKMHRDWPPRHEELKPYQASRVRQKGDMLSDSPRLHLHCQTTRIPDVATILNDSTGKHRSSHSELQFVAPLPLHMEASWGLKDPYTTTVGSVHQSHSQPVWTHLESGSIIRGCC